MEVEYLWQFQAPLTGTFEEYRNRKYQACVRGPDSKEFRWEQREHDYSFQRRDQQVAVLFGRKGKSTKDIFAYDVK